MVHEVAGLDWKEGVVPYLVLAERYDIRSWTRAALNLL